MLEIAIDIGGTFTDIVGLQDQQRLFLAKVPSTPRDLVQGVQQGVARVLALAGQPATAVERFIHSTTIATNAILEQKGAITGVLMTAGFEDVLEIGRQKRSQMYDLFLDPETPSFLAPRRQRVGIRERLDAAGNVLQSLDEPQVVQAVATLQQLYGVQSVAVCYLFSFINPMHELRTRELIVKNFPDLTVSLSSEIDPVFRILNARMADEIRLVSVRRGYDPRQFALVPLGGAGPVHGGRLAAMLSIPTTVVPTAPGVLSAFGLLVANIEHDQSRTFAVKADEVDVERIVQVLEELDLLGQEKMQHDHVPPELVHVHHAADLRYVGQSYELEVPLPGILDVTCGAQAVAAFHAAHRQVYGHSRPTHPVEFVNLRSVHSAPLPHPQLTVQAPGGSLAAAYKGTRPAYFDEYQAYRDTPTYQRDLLPLGTQFDGPAIVEQPDTTTVVYPDFTCRVDDAGNLLLTLRAC